MAEGHAGFKQSLSIIAQKYSYGKLPEAYANNRFEKTPCGCHHVTSLSIHKCELWATSLLMIPLDGVNSLLAGNVLFCLSSMMDSEIVHHVLFKCHHIWSPQLIALPLQHHLKYQRFLHTFASWISWNHNEYLKRWFTSLTSCCQ